MPSRMFITGCSGYLAQRLIEGIQGDPQIEWIGGNDIHPPREAAGLQFFQLDIRSSELPRILKENRVDMVVHLAWVFNPTHDPDMEYAVDVDGSRNVLAAVKEARIPYLIYLSSTTSYGPHSDNPPEFDENYPRRGHREYLYSKFKAVVDQITLEFIENNPEISVFMIRAPIVLGPHTKNIVTQLTGLPVMVGVKGFNPPMQFIHEEDTKNILVWALKERPVGVFNVSGSGVIRYSEIIHTLKKPALWLPAWLIYPVVQVAWKLRLLDFPASILDFVRYPWVASSAKFHSQYPAYSVRYSSKDALLAHARARWPEKFGEPLN